MYLMCYGHFNLPCPVATLASCYFIQTVVCRSFLVFVDPSRLFVVKASHHFQQCSVFNFDPYFRKQAYDAVKRSYQLHFFDSSIPNNKINILLQHCQFAHDRQAVISFSEHRPAPASFLFPLTDPMLLHPVYIFQCSVVSSHCAVRPSLTCPAGALRRAEDFVLSLSLSFTGGQVVTCFSSPVGSLPFARS